MYTGAVGILLALYPGDPDKYEEVFRDYSVASTSPPTLLGGELSVAVIRGDLPLLRRFCLNAINLPPGDCELLYGRAGCLAGLIQSSRILGNLVHGDLVLTLVRQIITAGFQSQGRLLKWQWHGKEYLGAVHGVAGILMTLVLCPPEILLEVDPTIMTLIENTVDFVFDECLYEGGNIRSSFNSLSDRLVHFCHGATGWIPVLCILADRLPARRTEFITRACSLGDVVWQRGLLASKGPGLCHGISGSVCALIDVFKLTGDAKWFIRAKWFSDFVCKEWQTLLHKADRPLSLFEGIAGVFYALHYISHMEKSRDRMPFTSSFPCF